MERGIGDAGKFERYFRIFRCCLLPLVHRRRTIEALAMPRTLEARDNFYATVWDNRRWNWVFRLFFSSFVMGHLGRDPSFFRYVEGSVAEQILARARHGLTVLDPSENPYLQWILFGEHREALPHWLRRDSVERIRVHLDRLEWRQQSVESFLASSDARDVSRLNLSDIFEYVSLEDYGEIMRTIAETVRPGARLVYWNMLAPRRRPDVLSDCIAPIEQISAELHHRDKAFFYRAFVVEETVAR